MTHTEGTLVADADLSLYLSRTDTRSGFTHNPHDVEPRSQIGGAFLKDGVFERVNLRSAHATGISHTTLKFIEIGDFLAFRAGNAIGEYKGLYFF